MSRRLPAVKPKDVLRALGRAGVVHLLLGGRDFSPDERHCRIRGFNP